MTRLTGLFLDTGKLEEIEKYHRLGIIRGVTTNPTILLRDGIGGGWEGMQTHCREMARLVDPLPVSFEVTAGDPAEMREQARLMAGWGKNAVVKIPIHGPNGGTEYLKLAHELESKGNIRVNVTAMLSAQQCLLAAMAGATYVSIFGGRVNNMGYDSRTEIRRTRSLLDAFGNGAKIIAGSTREALNVIEWFEAGADIVTVVPSLVETILVHPYSKETVRQFLEDGTRLQKK
ncbi:MAG: transaldolase [Nitrospirae bacterium]|nr:transaldolase [Nitrospirota bacterium]